MVRTQRPWLAWVAGGVLLLAATGARAIYLDEEQNITLRARIYSQAAVRIEDSQVDTVPTTKSRPAGPEPQLLQPRVRRQADPVHELDERQLGSTGCRPTISASASPRGASTTASTTTARRSSTSRRSRSTPASTTTCPPAARCRPDKPGCSTKRLVRHAAPNIKLPTIGPARRTSATSSRLPAVRAARHLRPPGARQRALPELHEGPVLPALRQAEHLLGRVRHHRPARSEQPVRSHAGGAGFLRGHRRGPHPALHRPHQLQPVRRRSARCRAASSRGTGCRAISTRPPRSCRCSPPAPTRRAASTRRCRASSPAASSRRPSSSSSSTTCPTGHLAAAAGAFASRPWSTAS